MRAGNRLARRGIEGDGALALRQQGRRTAWCTALLGAGTAFALFSGYLVALAGAAALGGALGFVHARRTRRLKRWWRWTMDRRGITRVDVRGRSQHMSWAHFRHADAKTVAEWTPPHPCPAQVELLRRARACRGEQRSNTATERTVAAGAVAALAPVGSAVLWACAQAIGAPAMPLAAFGVVAFAWAALALVGASRMPAWRKRQLGFDVRAFVAGYAHARRALPAPVRDQASGPLRAQCP